MPHCSTVLGVDLEGTEGLARLREEYGRAGLTEDDLTPDPFAMFGRWFAEVRGSGLHEPNAMVVATVSPQGQPSARMVLLKQVTGEGFVFFTNFESHKGVDLAANPRCALLFGWHPLERQIRIEGVAEPVGRDAVEDYFAQRPRGSQWGAWASPQSRPVASREELARNYDAAVARFPEPDPVPAPPAWGGYLVRPELFEFWQGRPGRMHDRFEYRRAADDPDAWTTTRLAP